MDLSLQVVLSSMQIYASLMNAWLYMVGMHVNAWCHGEDTSHLTYKISYSTNIDFDAYEMSSTIALNANQHDYKEKLKWFVAWFLHDMAWHEPRMRVLDVIRSEANSIDKESNQALKVYIGQFDPWSVKTLLVVNGLLKLKGSKSGYFRI